MGEGKENKGKIVFSSLTISIRGISEKELPEASDVQKTKSCPDAIDKFSSIAQRFVTVTQMLWKYMHEIGAVAEQTSITNLASLPVLLRELKDRQKKATAEEKPFAVASLKIEGVDQEGKTVTKETEAPIYEISHLEKIQEHQKYHNAAFRILHETALQQLVNSWECILGDILAWHLENNPDSAPKDKTLTYAEILQLNSLSDAQRKVIDKEVEEFLKNKDTDQQLHYLKEELKADLSSHFCKLPELKEAILRRHALVHAGGIVTGEYIRRVNKIKKLDIELPSEGKILPLKASYVRNAWHNFYSSGVILLHIISKNYSRSIKSKDDENRADSFLLNAAFSNIENQQYDSAKLILEYAIKHRLVNESSNLIAKVNLAQTLKWQGNESGCNDILGQHDWSACNNVFQLCVSSLREDLEKFKSLLKVTAQQKDLSISEIYEWPVFKKLIEHPDFDAWVEDAYSCKKPEKLSHLSPKILDFSPEKRLEGLLEIVKAKDPQECA